jgi:hypothetical protein
VVIYFKRLILKGFIVLSPLLVILLFGRDFSAFVIVEEPNTITKGNLGHSLMIEISYSPSYIDEWLTNSKSTNYVLMLDPDWIERSPSSMKIIKDRKISTGLLITQKEEPQSLPTLLEKYEKIMGELPLWVSCTPSPCTTEQVSYLYSQKTNVAYPPITLTNEAQLKQLEDGSIVKIKLDDQFKLNEEQLLQLINHPFISLEENILGYQIKTKRMPE